MYSFTKRGGDDIYEWVSGGGGDPSILEKKSLWGGWGLDRYHLEREKDPGRNLWAPDIGAVEELILRGLEAPEDGEEPCVAVAEGRVGGEGGMGCGI